MHGRDTVCRNTACCGERSARARSRRLYNSSPRDLRRSGTGKTQRASILVTQTSCGVTRIARSAPLCCRLRTGNTLRLAFRMRTLERLQQLLHGWVELVLAQSEAVSRRSGYGVNPQRPSWSVLHCQSGKGYSGGSKTLQTSNADVHVGMQMGTPYLLEHRA